MSVYKPKQSRIWQYDFVVAGRRYVGSTGVLNRRAAEEFERRMRQEVATGKLGAIGQLPLDEAAGRYWEEKGRHRGDAVDVERRIEVLLSLLGPQTRLSAIDQAVVADAIERRRTETFRKAKGDKARAYPVSNSTVNRDIIETLRPILKRARTHWSPQGTLHGLPEIDWRDLRLSEPRAQSRVYSQSEKAAWLAACDGDVRLALDMMLTYGLRYGELFFALHALNLDVSDPTLTLQKGRKRDVILHLPLRRDHARALTELVAKARGAGIDQVWCVEVGETVTPLTYGMLEHRISKAANAAKISGGRRIHGARHHAGSMILKKTKNLKAVQGLLGHARVSSSERYAHVLTEELRAALDDDEPLDPQSAEDAGDRK
ncbi:tyrosine-type recombinase/integrase [Phenylobacterium ferrooxidans]|uniref:Site-specific integrase n=1 Tax=Phenylobacterium ferrooxidans TaxID=2982689 RepID=A0ABW6CM95_9CAUL